MQFQHRTPFGVADLPAVGREVHVLDLELARGQQRGRASGGGDGVQVQPAVPLPGEDDPVVRPDVNQPPARGIRIFDQQEPAARRNRPVTSIGALQRLAHERLQLLQAKARHGASVDEVFRRCSDFQRHGVVVVAAAVQHQDVAGRALQGNYRNIRAYVAGPPPAVDAALRLLLLEGKLTADNIRYDKFS